MQQGSMSLEEFGEICALVAHLQLARKNLRGLVERHPLNEGARLALVRLNQCILGSGFEDEIDEHPDRLKEADQGERENHESD